MIAAPAQPSIRTPRVRRSDVADGVMIELASVVLRLGESQDQVEQLKSEQAALWAWLERHNNTKGR